MERLKHPEERANFVSKLTFYWLIDLFKYGHTNEITADDIGKLRQDDSSAKLSKTFSTLWAFELSSGRKSLWRIIAKLYATKVIICGFLFSTLDTICRCVKSSRININVNKKNTQKCQFWRTRLWVIRKQLNLVFVSCLRLSWDQMRLIRFAQIAHFPSFESDFLCLNFSSVIKIIQLISCRPHSHFHSSAIPHCVFALNEKNSIVQTNFSLIDIYYPPPPLKCTYTFCLYSIQKL